MSGPFIPIAWIASRFINTRTYKGMGQCDIEKEKKLEKGWEPFLSIFSPDYMKVFHFGMLIFSDAFWERTVSLLLLTLLW